MEGGHPLEHYDWTIPTAVVLGNEREGVSEEAKVGWAELGLC